MDDDALVRTLSARITSLERTVKANEERIEQQQRQLAMATRASEILRHAGAEDTGPMPPVPPPRPAVKRDRSHLRAVKGIGIMAVLGALWHALRHLLWGSTGRRVMTAAGGLALGGATVLTPAVHAAGSPPQPHTSFRPQRPAVTAPGGPPPRHHTRATAGTRQQSKPHSAPSAAPSVVPSPSPSSGPPVPLPSPTLPVPLPTPTVPPAGCVHHPHPGCPTPPAGLPSLPDGNVLSAADWLRSKTHRLKLLGAAS